MIEKNNSKKNIVRLDPILKELIPTFFSSVDDDLKKLDQAVVDSDMENVMHFAHMLKGDFGSYGFNDLSALASAMEEAARISDWEKIRNLVIDIQSYLAAIVVEYQ